MAKSDECSVPECKETQCLTEHGEADELNGGEWRWRWCPRHERELNTL